MSNSILGNLFGRAPVKQEGTIARDDSHYDAIANNYGASMHKSIAALQNSTALNHMNALAQQSRAIPTPRPAPEPKDVPALAISLDVAYDLWAAKHGYEWVNINAVDPATQRSRYQMGRGAVPGGWVPTVSGSPLQAGTPTGTYTVTINAEPPEPEFDWYTVARRLVHVRALENEGGYYRLVPKEWCK